MKKRIVCFLIAFLMAVSAVNITAYATQPTVQKDFFKQLADLVNRQDHSKFFGEMELHVGSDILTVDGEDQVLTAAPEITDERTMLPIRAVAEAAGAEVDWNPNTFTVLIESASGDMISCSIGSYILTINDEICQMDVAPYIKQDKTYLPVRAVSEALELDVDWDELTRTIRLTAPYQTARLIVLADQLDTRGLDAETVLSDGTGMWVLQFDSPTQARRAAETLEAQGIAVEPDRYIPSIDDDDASDLAMGGTHYSWGADDCGFDSFISEYSGQFTGKGVVAVVDSGVDSNHSFLRGRVLNDGFDFIDGDNKPDDGLSHGTHVSGIIIDCVGSAPVSILPIRIFNDEGIGYSTTTSAGIKYAADYGADVINLSLGGEHNMAKDSAISYAIEKGCLVVAAAGNENRDTAYLCPAHIKTEGVIVVSAGDSKHNKASFSNYGSSVDLMAPGVSIKATVPGGGYGIKSGTSMATPHAAAAAMLIDLALGKTLTPAALEKELYSATTYGKWTNSTVGAGFLDLSKVEIPSNHSHEYNSLGKCNICGKTFDLSITKLNQNMTITSVNSSGIAPVHNSPYSDTTITKSYTKGQVITINGSAKNAFGKLWYRLSDNAWISSEYVSSHTHSYDSAGKCSCGESFQLSINKLDQNLTITSVNSSGVAPAYNAPYSDATIAKRYTKGQVITVNGSAKNAFGKLWYRLSDNTWISDEYVSSHTHSYDSLGKCSCGELFQLNITKLNQKMTIIGVNGTNTAPAHSTPYGDATVTKRYNKDQVVTVTGSSKNAFGNLWYQLSDGSWMVSGYLSSHTTHSYDSLGKCSCGELFQLNITKLNQKMSIIGVNGTNTAPAHSTPYGDATVTKRYNKDQVVTVTGSSKNAFGNLWYQLSDGSWMVSGYLSSHTTHSYDSLGKCVCGVSFQLSITKLNQKMTIIDVNGTNTAPAHSSPYGDATITKRYNKDQVVTVTGSSKNAFGNLWYQLSDGSWMVSGYLSTHLHTWEGAGKCSSCGKTYSLVTTTLSPNKKGTITAVNGSGTAPTHTTPYGDATVKTRYKKDQTVTVAAQAKNAYGNLWYQLTNGEWILADYVTLK